MGCGELPQTNGFLHLKTCASDQPEWSGQKGDGATLFSLASRQREVLQLIAEDRGTQKVTMLFNIAVKTVGFHKFRLMDQLNLHSIVALAKHAIAEGLVGP